MKSEEAVLIFLQFGLGSLDNEKKLDAIFALEDILREIVEESGLGIFDGNEFCEDTVMFFIYGSDAEKIHALVSPILSHIPYLKGSYILKQYKNGSEKQIMLRVHS